LESVKKTVANEAIAYCYNLPRALRIVMLAPFFELLVYFAYPVSDRSKISVGGRDREWCQSVVK